MVEYTMLTKGILLVFVLFIVYKTELYKIILNFVFGFVDKGFKKLNSLNGVRMDHNKDLSKRKKYIDNMLKKVKKGGEL